MLVVTVVFEPKPEHAPAFRAAMLDNARASRETEPGCRQFDVCVDPASGTIFLYELYDDRAAFEAHMRTAHFLAFDAATRDWIARKDVRIYERLAP
ncbi:MAG: antibiotic biosynthesis monooxygenase [Betaproteobacteria bacterium]|jgi:quinol monooxygenase YgiN|nr:antibiotic biosynthesis monooxygenase [Betaproteobacteria bacterium]MDH5288348.1 antibiotic biosynthesis monooxygenase [Betaproteobacteria bacterium]